jgi:hypothetical protein
VILGAVTLTACHLDAECRHMENGRYVVFCSRWAMRDQAHWQVAGARLFTQPVPANGRLGLWGVTGDAADAVLGQRGHTDEDHKDWRGSHWKSEATTDA